MRNLFVALNSYYWNSIQERNTLEDLTSSDSWISSLIHFCNYAFERQGSPVVYRESAKKTFRRNREWLENRETWSNDIEVQVFSTFSELCKDSGLNEKNNPMTPTKKGKGSLISLIYFAWNETKRASITRWTLNSLQSDNLKKAFKCLKKIRGVGDKISSFYLRDIYILSGYNKTNLQNRHLLHPIDRWTRRAARILSRDNTAPDKKCAEILIDLEDELGIVTGVSNVAFWVLGSQIAEDEKTFTDLVQSIRDRNRTRLSTLLSKKISEQREWLFFLETLLIN